MQNDHEIVACIRVRAVDLNNRDESVVLLMSDIKVGILIDEHAQRDAIHVAIAPVIAGDRLKPGQHVGFVAGSTSVVVPIVDGPSEPQNKPSVGIVDPYLTIAIYPGQRFWLFLYPQTVTSLRHDWTHPAFTESTTIANERSPSEQWLRNFAEEVGVSYGVLMDAAANWLRSTGKWDGDYHVLSYDTPDVVYTKCEEMWRHYEIVTGVKVDNKGATFFTCSC